MSPIVQQLVELADETYSRGFTWARCETFMWRNNQPCGCLLGAAYIQKFYPNHPIENVPTLPGIDAMVNSLASHLSSHENKTGGCIGLINACIRINDEPDNLSWENVRDKLSRHRVINV